MNFYQEITLHPESDITVNFLWSKIFPIIHKGFALFKDGNNNCPFAVAFPQYAKEGEKIGVGGKLQIFSETKEKLMQLDLKMRLQKLEDYMSVTGIRPVPMRRVTGYAVYSRKHVEDASRARRYARRHDIDEEETQKKFNAKREMCSLPFIRMDSGSTGQRFCLFIDKKEVTMPEKGSFGCYGLSNSATVPVI